MKRKTTNTIRKKKVLLKINIYHQVKFTSRIVEFLQDVLCRDCAHDPDNSLCRQIRDEIELQAGSENSLISLPAGLTNHLKRLLKCAGYAVRVHGERPSLFMESNSQFSPEVDTPAQIDPPLTQSLVCNVQGQVEVHKFDQLISLIELLFSLLDGTRTTWIVVAVPTVPMQIELLKRLEEFDISLWDTYQQKWPHIKREPPYTSRLFSHDDWVLNQDENLRLPYEMESKGEYSVHDAVTSAASHRESQATGINCLVCCHQSILEPPNRFQSDLGLPSCEEGVLLLYGAERATSSSISIRILNSWFRHVYACRDFNAPLSSTGEYRLKCIAGDVIYRHSAPPTNVNVQFVKSPHVKVNMPECPIQRKRKCYWKNNSRNRMIAHLAKAVHHGDESSLRKMGLTPDRIRYFKQYRHKKLVVLVESSEQGKALQRYLKCPLFSTDSETTDSTTKVIQIATLTFAFQHSMYATVILNAIGDMEPPAISPKRMWNTHDNTLPRLMIELWDDFNEKVEKHSQSRLKIYQRELRAVWWP